MTTHEEVDIDFVQQINKLPYDNDAEVISITRENIADYISICR